MKFLHCQSSIHVAEKTRELLKSLALEKKEPLHAFLPTGRTPRELYRLLREEKDFWERRLVPLQVDEFVDAKRLFFNELRENILRPLDLESRGFFIDPAFTDDAMAKHILRVTDLGVDVAVLGMGPNGHVGFHEPGLPEKFLGGRVTVEEETMARVAGATTREVLTFGAGSFLKARHIVLLVTGNEKKNIFERFTKSTATPDLPATLLKGHSNLTIISDLTI